MAATRARIPIPNKTDVFGTLTLAAKLYEKHQTDGADSVIRGELKTDLEAVGPDIALGLKYHAQAEAMKKKLEDLYELRDNIADRARPVVQRSSKSLQGEYGTKNLRRMGDHGFIVDDTPKAPKQPKAPKAPKA